jgi:hypothetical protein
METIRIALEQAVNNTFPMRTLKRGEWGVAGNFYVNEKKYAFYGIFNSEEITCRCMEEKNYANHWFKMKRDWVGDNLEIPVITIGECIG